MEDFEDCSFVLAEGSAHIDRSDKDASELLEVVVAFLIVATNRHLVQEAESLHEPLPPRGPSALSEDQALGPGTVQYPPSATSRVRNCLEHSSSNAARSVKFGKITCPAKLPTLPNLGCGKVTCLMVLS
jgi:hypothetical protein